MYEVRLHNNGERLTSQETIIEASNIRIFFKHGRVLGETT